MEYLEFESEDLDYSTIENEITNFYGIGYPNSSNFMELEVGVHGGYSIFASNGIIEFSAIVGKKKDNEDYSITIRPKRLKKN